jgi:hypothetical protein
MRRCQTDTMRRGATTLAVVVLCLVGVLVAMSSPRAVGAVVPRCAANSVRVTDYKSAVGAGNVNDLFWIRNVSSSTCSLRGYVRVAYVGVYGIGATTARPHSLVVSESRSYGRDGNDLGGLKMGVSIPTVILKRHGLASFWLYGTDEQHGTPPSRCIVSHEMLVWLPGSAASLTVNSATNDGYYWCGGFAAHPIVAGESGSDPAVRLSYYFGIPTP